MKVKLMWSTFAGLICFALLSCSDKDNPVTRQQPSTSQSPLSLVPLKIGNSWTFRVTTYDTTGSVARIDTLRFFIKTDTIVNNMHWYLEGYDGVMIGQLAFRNDSVGFHETNFENLKYDYPYPAEKGQSNWFYSVESTDSVVTTPLGNLHCYVYKYDWFGRPGRMIFAPGIGWVRTEGLGGTSSNTVWLSQTMDLIAAKIDSAAN